MFKYASCDTELMQSMEKNLVASQDEKASNSSKIARAIEYLSVAANIFDDANMLEEADDIAKILESCAKEISLKK